jgi:putative FmdB family regulatory protein
LIRSWGALQYKQMPLYDYRCEKCGQTFEVRQKFADETLTVHEGCGGAVERLISLPAIQFKGTGWYVTDYGKGGKSPSTAGKESGDSKSDSRADSKSDSKAESKSESKSDSKSDTKAESKTESKSKPESAPAAPASTAKEK